MKRVLNGVWRLAAFAGLFLAASAGAQELDSSGWRKPTAEELAMTSEPLAPGAPAVYLYTQSDGDDNSRRWHYYRQLKVLTEEGREQANIRIPYDRQRYTIRDVEARVVQPDGSVVPFAGTVYEQPIASNQDIKYYAKTLTLPDVRVGSILDLRYSVSERGDERYYSRWLLSQDLFTRHAKFSLRPDKERAMRWDVPRGLPAGTKPPDFGDRTLRMEVRNIPAFVTEQYMPPENDLKLRVDFIYAEEARVPKDPAVFWKQWGRTRYGFINAYAEKSGAIRKALSGVIADGDSDEQKARKIYAHVQGLRNRSYERELDEQEQGRSKDQDAWSVADVAKRGYGNSVELLLYGLSLLRAAGLEAEPVLAAGRRDHFFSPRTMNQGELNSWLVAVKLDGKDLLLDPSVPFLPFGMLHWSDTAVQALKLDGQGGQWITTPVPELRDAVSRRVAKLELGTDGMLEGTVTATYTGHEAIWRRLRERNEDEQARKEFLEADLKDSLQGSATVNLVSQPDWTSAEAPLRVEYRVKVPEWTVLTGGRLLLGVGLFGAEEKGVFVSPDRLHPVYYAYPFQAVDEVQVKLPTGYRLQNAPLAQAAGQGALQYGYNVQSEGDTLTIRREFGVDALFSSPASYPRFREFYQAVRSGDEQQVVLAR